MARTGSLQSKPLLLPHFYLLRIRGGGMASPTHILSRQHAEGAAKEKRRRMKGQVWCAHTHLHLGDGVCYSSDRQGQRKRNELKVRKSTVAVLAEVVRKVLRVQAVEHQEAAQQEGLVCRATGTAFQCSAVSCATSPWRFVPPPSGDAERRTARRPADSTSARRRQNAARPRAHSARRARPRIRTCARGHAVCAAKRRGCKQGRGAPLHEGMMVPQYSFSRRPDATASCQLFSNILPIFPFVFSLCSANDLQS